MVGVHATFYPGSSCAPSAGCFVLSDGGSVQMSNINGGCDIVYYDSPNSTCSSACFLPGTEIGTKDRTIAVEKVKAGDVVKSFTSDDKIYLLNSFIKKTKTTPSREIDIALKRITLLR